MWTSECSWDVEDGRSYFGCRGWDVGEVVGDGVWRKNRMLVGSRLGSRFLGVCDCGVGLA